MVYLHHPPSIPPEPPHLPVYPALFSLMVYPSARSSYLPVYHMAMYLLAYASVHVDNSDYFPHPSTIYSRSVHHSSPAYSSILSSLCQFVHHPSIICPSVHPSSVRPSVHDSSPAYSSIHPLVIPLSVGPSIIIYPSIHHLSIICPFIIHPSSVHPAIYHQSVD